MEALFVLPNSNELSPHLLGILDEHFKSHEDLSRASAFVTELKKNCIDSESSLTNLQNNLSSLLNSWVSRSNGVKCSLNRLKLKFQNSGFYPSQEKMEKVRLKKIGKILGEELPLLAKEMLGIEAVRIYAVTTLQLEVLVGDVEDAVLCIMNLNTRNTLSADLSSQLSATDFGRKQRKLLLAVKAINDIEEILISTVNCWPRWRHLLKSVDSRVDKTLAVLRPQALADHRALLASLGWPPPLLTSESESEKGSGIPNPLVLMQGDKRERYCQNFLALCALQHLQTCREQRQLDNLRHESDYSSSLWTIDELVYPITSRAEHHFSKWSDQPKFIFALVYKITRDFVEGVDDVLQPLIDKAELVGYSAKEAWVSSMVKMLSDYLKKRFFSALVERYKEKSEKAEFISLWLHLIDLIVAFNKRVQSLANLESRHFVESGISRRLSVLSIFCDRPDWLRIWAKFELKDSQKKLKAELEDERAWVIDTKQGTEFYIEKKTEPFPLSTREDHKAPLIAEVVVKITWAMIERCQTLPDILLRVQFIRFSATRFLWQFFNVLLQRCKEAECKPGYSEDDTLMQVSTSINAARYCESILREWSEDVDFLEMRIAEDDSSNGVKYELNDHSCFFGEEIKCLAELQTNWLMEITGDLLRQFDTLSSEYIQNWEQWGQEQEDSVTARVLGAGDLTVSVDFVEALDTLRNRFGVLKVVLNSKDFLDLWRSVAGGLDHFIFGSVLMNEARFSGHGIDQFIADMQAVFLVFHPFCARPEAFFPCIRDSLKLLEMGIEDVKHMQTVLSKSEEKMVYFQRRGILHVTPDQADKIVRNRKIGA